MDQVLQQLRVQAGTEHELAPYVHTPDEVLPQLALSLGLNDQDGGELLGLQVMPAAQETFTWTVRCSAGDRLR